MLLCISIQDLNVGIVMVSAMGIVMQGVGVTIEGGISMDKDTKHFLVSKLCNTGISVIAVLMSAFLGANVPLPN